MTVPNPPFLVRTKVAWTGEEDGDLGFLENEVVKVFHIVDELWWQGSLVRNGTEGIFPRDFVQIVSSPQLTPRDTPKATPTKLPVSALSTPSKSKHSPAKSPVLAATSAPYQMPPLPTKLQTLPYKYPASRSMRDLQSSADSKPNRQLYSQHVLSLGLTAQHQAADKGHNEHAYTSFVHANSVPNLSRKLRQSRDLLVGLENTREQAYTLGKAASKESVATSDAKRDPFYESLHQKKKELEDQLLALRELEKVHIRKHQLETSFVSEDLALSRRPVSQDLLRDLDSEEGPPPPPKHTRVPFDADDFRALGASVEERMRCLYPEAMKDSLKSIQSDVLNLLELSATSAGSFMRHKEQSEHTYLVSSVQERLAQASLESGAGITFDDTNNMSQDKRYRHPNIFKMLMKKKPEQNLMEQRLQQAPDDWQLVKANLNRVNTLTLLDKQARTKAVARSEVNFILKPLEYVSEFNLSETFGPDDITPGEISFNNRKVAEFVRQYPIDYDLNEFIADISVKFSSWVPDQIRAILLHLCKFRIVEENDKISQLKPKIAQVLGSGEATVFQLTYLFKKLLEALRIPSEVVCGFWKKPNEFYHSDQFAVNHCWLSVMVETDDAGNGCFRLIDIMCFQNGSVCNLPKYNEFYFLTAPFDLVSTHIPSVIELQHVCPPIDVNVAFHLPRMYSGFKKCELRFLNFNNALTRMTDLEFFETDLVLPPTVELFTLIKTSRKTTNDYTLCQIHWKGTQRIAKIKAILPENESIGVLQIFAGPKGQQTHFDNIHELACVIPLYHTGSSKPCTFVPRFPTIQSQNNDLYIKHPQLSAISWNNSYNFEIEVHPLMGTLAESAPTLQNFKIVIESPSGKYTRLVKEKPHSPHSLFSLPIMCLEKGVYRGLVIGDSGNSWYVFAQWDCA